MGRNLDLIELYGLNNNVVCPKCKNSTEQCFEDYDVDCGDVLFCWYIKLDCVCCTCDYEWDYKFKVQIEEL